MPSKVTGFLGRQRFGNQEDPAGACIILLHYENGLLATLKASKTRLDTEQLRFWVRGDKGTYKKVRYPRCLKDLIPFGSFVNSEPVPVSRRSPGK